MNTEKKPEENISAAETKAEDTVKSAEAQADQMKEEGQTAAAGDAKSDKAEASAEAAPDQTEKSNKAEASAEAAPDQTEKSNKAEASAEAASDQTEKIKRARTERSKKSFFQSEKFKHGGTATAFTAGFIAVVILLNVFVGILAERFPSVNLDMTKSGSNTLSEDAIKIIDSVKIPVEITICATKQDCQNGTVTGGGDYAEVSRLFEETAERNSNIKLSYIDLDQNPAFAQTYKSDSISSGDVVVKSDKRYRVLTASNLFTSQTDSSTYQTTYYSNVDASIASALNNVISEAVPVAVFDTGHSESMDATGYKKILASSNFETKDINLLTDEIPEGTQLLVLGGATTDYTDAEIEKIQKYLQSTTFTKDRALLVAYSAGSGNLSKLDTYLAEWGLSTDTSEAVLETDSTKYYSNGLNLFGEVQSKPDLGGSTSSYQYFVMPYSSPITVKKVSGSTAAALVKSSETSGVIKSGESEPAEKAAQTVMAYSYTNVKYADGKYCNSSVILAGSTTMFSSRLLSSTAFSNGTYLTNLSRYATGTTQQSTEVTTTKRELYAKDISVTESTVRWIGFGIFTILIPLAVAVAGIIVYRRRRTL